MQRMPARPQDITLVLTDVEGSTELWEWDTDATSSAIDLHDRLMRQYSAKFFGYEVMTEVRLRAHGPATSARRGVLGGVQSDVECAVQTDVEPDAASML
eukprot:175077-Chlamydomonas_euryale.AAC.2